MTMHALLLHVLVLGCVVGDLHAGNTEPRVMNTVYDVRARNARARGGSVQTRGHRWTTLECVTEKEDNSHTCMLHNLVFYNANWTAVLPYVNSTVRRGKESAPAHALSYNVPPLRLCGKFGTVYRPEEKYFESEVERDAFLDGLELQHYDGITAYTTFPFHFNVGHFLYDGLYPMFQAVLRFRPPSTSLFVVGKFREVNQTQELLFWGVRGAESKRKRRLQSDAILRRFAGPHGFVDERALIKLHAGGGAVFASVIMGVEGIGLHQYGRTIQLREGVPGGMRHFRDRLFRVYGLPLPVPIERCSNGVHVRQGNMSCELPRGIIVDNKRFTARDKQVFAASAHEQRRKIVMQYLDWGDVQGGFRGQLALLSRTHVYVTGPGTGMLNHPFMPDGAVVVNVGEWLTRHRATCGRPHPHFMEVDVIAATWYYQSALQLSRKVFVRRSFSACSALPPRPWAHGSTALGRRRRHSSWPPCDDSCRPRARCGWTYAHCPQTRVVCW